MVKSILNKEAILRSKELYNLIRIENVSYISKNYLLANGQKIIKNFYKAL